MKSYHGGIFNPGIVPITQFATAETVALYQWLVNMSQSTQVVYGVEDHFRGWVTSYPTPTLIGSANSVKSNTGKNPYIVQYIYEDSAWVSRYGLSGTEALKQQIISDYSQGKIPMLFHPPGNPVTGQLSREGTVNPTPPGPYAGTGYAYDLTGSPVTACLPGGSKQDAFKAYLDRLADFIDSLVTETGTKIPVILRPWHEANGFWFWWSCEGSTQFVRLWRRTVEYLRDIRKLNNVLYHVNYSTDSTLTQDWYPGDGYADLISTDYYDNSLTDAVVDKNGILTTGYNMMISMTTAKKAFGIAEIGYQYGAQNTPGIWSASFNKVIESYPKVGFMLTYAWPYGPDTSDPSFAKTDLTNMVLNPNCVTLP